MELSPSNSVEIYHILDLTVTRWKHTHKMANKNCEKYLEDEEVSGKLKAPLKGNCADKKITYYKF